MIHKRPPKFCGNFGGLSVVVVLSVSVMKGCFKCFVALLYAQKIGLEEERLFNVIHSNTTTTKPFTTASNDLKS